MSDSRVEDVWVEERAWGTYVHVDLNGDGDFTDPTDVVISQYAVAAGDGSAKFDQLSQEVREQIDTIFANVEFLQDPENFSNGLTAGIIRDLAADVRSTVLARY